MSNSSHLPRREQQRFGRLCRIGMLCFAATFVAPAVQAATTSGLPVLLRTSATTGHIGTPLSARVAIVTDVHAFLLHELGVTYTPVGAGAK